MVQIEIIGNLGADVVEKDYNGNKFYTFNVCDNRKVNGQEISQWFSCNLNRATDVLQYLVKGQQVFVRGVPRFRIFDSATMHCKMVGIEIFVNELQLVGSSPRPNLTQDQVRDISTFLLSGSATGDKRLGELAAAFTLAYPVSGSESQQPAAAQEPAQQTQQPAAAQEPAQPAPSAQAGDESAAKAAKPRGGKAK